MKTVLAYWIIGSILASAGYFSKAEKCQQWPEFEPVKMLAVAALWSGLGVVSLIGYNTPEVKIECDAS